MRRRQTGMQEIYEPGRVDVRMEAPRAAVPAVATSVVPAWARLADVAASTGLIVNDALAKEYYREQVGRVDDSVLEAARRFEKWKSEYNEANQGKEGVNALKDYEENYARICGEVEKEFDGDKNEIFGDLLRRRLAERGLSAIKEGAGWASRQRALWLASQWAAQLADFSAYAAANPEDGEGIAFRRQGLMQSWAAKNPGQDPGAMRGELNGVEFKQRMEGFLANGDAAGARAYLAGYGRLAGLRPEASNTEWLLAHNNPGSVTVDGRNFAAYATPRDGLKAIMGRFNSYYYRHKKKTIRAMIGMYAPPNENDTGAYVRYVAERTGLDPDKELNIRDPKVLAALTGAVLGQEHSQRADEGELMAAAEEFLRTGEPKAVGVIWRDRSKRGYLPGFDPATFRHYEERLANLERGEAAQADLAKAEAILEEVKSLPMERRTMAILKIIQDMPREEAERMRPLLKRGVEERKELDALAQGFALRDDFTASMKKMVTASDEALESLSLNMAARVTDPGLRQDFINFAAQEIQNRRNLRKANDAVAVQKFMESQTGKSPSEIQAALAVSDLSPEARKRAGELSWGLARDENPANMRSLTLGLMLKDAGLMDNEEEIESFAARNNMTLAQVKQMREYQGKAARVSIQRVNTLLKNLNSMGDFDGPDQIDARAYRILLEQLPPGREPSDQDLMELLATLYISDGSFFFKKSVMDELMAEQFNMDWLPEVKAWQRPELEAELKRRNLKPSESNLRKLLKLRIFQRQGWPLKEAPVFE